MSHVDNCILSFNVMEDPGMIDDVNSFFDDRTLGRGKHDYFVSADGDFPPYKWYGGTKYLETPLFIAALNYFAEEEFMRHLRSLNWQKPKSVQLIIKRQDEDSFVIRTC